MNKDDNRTQNATQKKVNTSRSKSIPKNSKTTRSTRSISKTKSIATTVKVTMKEKDNKRRTPVLKSKPKEKSPSPSPKSSPMKGSQLRSRSSRTKESPAKVVNKRRETFGSPQERPKRLRGFQTKQESLNRSPNSSRSASAKNKSITMSKKGKKSAGKSSKPSPRKVANALKPTPNKKETSNKKATPKKTPSKGKTPSESENESEHESDNESENESKSNLSSNSEDMEIEKPEVPDVSIPDPVTGFIRNEQGKLVRAINETEKEIQLRKNLDHLLDDETCQIKMKMTAIDKSQAPKANKDEPESSEEESDDEGIFIDGYNLYEDHKLLLAAEAFRIANKGTRGLLGKNIWATMTDPHTGERLCNEKRNERSLCNRYSKYLIYLSEAQKLGILELGTKLDEFEMKRLKCMFQSALSMKYLTGIYKKKIHKHGPYERYNVLVISPEELVKDIKLKEPIEEEEEEEKEESEMEEEEKEEVEEEEENSDQDFDASELSRNKLALQNIIKEKQIIIRKNEEESIEEEEEEENLILQHAKAKKGKIATGNGVEVQKGGEKKTARQLQIAKNNLKRPLVEKKLDDEEEEVVETKKKYRTNLGDERKLPQSSRQPIYVEKQYKPVSVGKRKPATEEIQLPRKIDQLKAQEELKKLKEIWQYDANSLIASDSFGLRNYTGAFEFNPNLCLYVDMRSRFRQFVHEKISSQKNEQVVDKSMKWGRLANYSQRYHIPLDKMISLFNSVSCDIIDLERYLNTGEKNILWSSQEDKDLLANNITALRYITRIKGPERMKKRRDYLLNVS